MRGLLYSIWLQCKLDLRNMNVLSAYYVMPFAFFLVIGAVFETINPEAQTQLIPTMSILSISIAAFLGTPAPLVEFFASDCKKTYKVGNIKLYVVLITTFLSAFVHMIIVSTLIFAVATFIFDVSRPTDVVLYFFWLVITGTVSILLGMVVGLIAKNNSTMIMISQFLFLPTMLLSGVLLPTDLLPDILQNIGQILPATYAVEIITSLTEVTSEMVYPLLAIGFAGLVLLVIQYHRLQKD